MLQIIKNILYYRGNIIKTLCHYEQKDFCPHTASLEAIHQAVHPLRFTQTRWQRNVEAPITTGLTAMSDQSGPSHMREYRLTFDVGFSHGKDV